MKNTVKIIISITMMLSLCFISNNEVKASENHTLHNTNSLCNTTYSINDDNQIIESAVCELNESSILIHRVINEDGSYIATINDDTNIFEYSGEADYPTFYKIATAYLKYSALSLTRGCNMNTSNFKHVFIGFQPSVTITAADYAIAGGIIGLSAIIANRLKFVDQATALEIAAIATGLLGATAADKVVINTRSYEIRFSYDDVYYTHCYHQVILSYDSAGNLIDREESYNQVIGG